MLQLGNHICVHTSRDLRFFHQLVRLGEIKILLDRTAIKQQIVLLIFPSGLDGIVEEAVDLGGETILYGIKGPWEFLSGIECGKFLADRQEFLVDLSDRIHIKIQLDTQFLAEDIDQFYCGSSWSSGEVPYIRINDIHPIDNGGYDRRQSVTGRTMRMEIHRYFQALLEQSHQFRRTSRRYQTTHILQGDHICAQRLQLKGLV